jgi:D-xylose 1-dehydrogenase (NADP+, D-xylono-1,5-lactone-forming)
MADTIRWGILSTANIGARRVIPAIHNAVNGTVSAVASRTIASAQVFADENNIPTAYGSYEDLLADKNIDAIYIPLPNSMHHEWALKCAEAGKPTLCEKPLAANADEAQQMVDAFKAKNLLFAEAFMYRFHPQNQRVQQMVQDGAVGDVHLMNASFSFRIDPQNTENIRLSKELAGGALMDIGCYCINAMRFITGEEPSVAKASAIFGTETDVDERTVATLRFPSGALGHLDASLRTAFNHTYEVRGTEGRIILPESFVPNYASGQPTFIHYWKGNDYEAIEVAAADHYQIMVEDFADALLHSHPPRFDPQDGVNNMRVIDALLQSARSTA